MSITFTIPQYISVETNPIQIVLFHPSLTAIYYLPGSICAAKKSFGNEKHHFISLFLHFKFFHSTPSTFDTLTWIGPSLRARTCLQDVLVLFSEFPLLLFHPNFYNPVQRWIIAQLKFHLYCSYENYSFLSTGVGLDFLPAIPTQF